MIIQNYVKNNLYGFIYLFIFLFLINRSRFKCEHKFLFNNLNQNNLKKKTKKYNMFLTVAIIYLKII
jgi:hypothetical protein